MPDCTPTAAPGPAVISRSTATAVRRVLHALRDGWVLEHHVGRAARMIAADAHRHGLRAEEMLVALTRECAGLARARRAPEGGDARNLAQRLVTLCIHEFYAHRATGRRCAVQACRTH